jgi:hypothetical protein
MIQELDKFATDHPSITVLIIIIGGIALIELAQSIGRWFHK